MKTRNKPELIRGFYLTFLILLSLSLTKSADAQIFGEAARTEFFGGLGIRTFYSRINRTQLLLDGDKISDPNAPKVFLNLTPVAIVYGVRPKLSLIAVVPTVRRTFESTSGSRRVSETDFGLGDVTLLGKYRFYKQDAFLASRQLAFQFGVKLPTGSEEKSLGSGSLDYRFALTFTEARNRLIFSGDLAYALNTEANNFEFGDAFNYDVAVKFRAFPSQFRDGGSLHQLFVFLELNGLQSAQAKSDGYTVGDSGGHQLFLSPGFQFFVLENLLWEAGVQIPVVQELNGTQLGVDFHFRTGVRWFLVP